MSTCSQKSKSLEGYYNLSEFEMAARLYLLDDGQFYYSASFGSVDLEIYGNYTIENNSIKLHPREEQMQPFALYGRDNKTITNEVEFYYYKPDEDNRYDVVFSLDDNWVKNTAKQENENEVYFKVKQKQPKVLKIGYPALFSEKDNFFRVGQVSKATITNKDNAFVLNYNRYYSMRRQFTSAAMPLEDGNILSGEKVKKRQDLQEGEREKIVAFLKVHEMFESSITVKEKLYKKIALTTDSSKPLLKPEANGSLKEITIKPISNQEPINIKNWKTVNETKYTISYPKNWENKAYEERKTRTIISPEKISGIEINISEGNLKDIEAYVKKWKKKINNRVLNNGLTVVKNKSPNNLIYEMKFADPLKGIEVIKHFYHKNNTILNINTLSDDKNKAVVAKILATFKIKD